MTHFLNWMGADYLSARAPVIYRHGRRLSIGTGADYLSAWAPITYRHGRRLSDEFLEVPLSTFNQNFTLEVRDGGSSSN